MTDLNVDLSGSDADSLKDLKVGDRVCLNYLEGTVKSNDGENLSVSVSEIEPDEAKCGPADDSEDSADASAPDESPEGEKPIAVVAMMGKKK